jgi:hypothetical protein
MATISIPSGPIGIVFKGVPPTLTTIKDSSALKGKANEGWVVSALTLGDGTVHSGFNTPELLGLLRGSTRDNGRVLTLSDPNSKPLSNGAVHNNIDVSEKHELSIAAESNLMIDALDDCQTDSIYRLKRHLVVFYLFLVLYHLCCEA